MKIERPAPRPLLCNHTIHRDCTWIRHLVKYAALTVAGILLFRWGHAVALTERGYEALGGEVFALFLPVFYWMISRTVRDILGVRKGNGTW